MTSKTNKYSVPAMFKSLIEQPDDNEGAVSLPDNNEGVVSLPDDELMGLYAKLDAIRQFCDSVQQEMIERVEKDPDAFPKCKLITRSGRKTWEKDLDILQITGQLKADEEDMLFKKALKTPTQLETLKKMVPENVQSVIDELLQHQTTTAGSKILSILN